MLSKDQFTELCAKLKVKKFICPLEFWAAKHHVPDLEEEDDDEERSHEEILAEAQAFAQTLGMHHVGLV